MQRVLTPLAVGLLPFVIAACSSSGGTPTTTTTPAPPPPSVPSASPASLAFGASTAPAQTLTVQETSYVGAFTLTDTCAGIASISAPSPADGPTVKYTITPSSAGTCTVTIDDSNGQKLKVGVTVTSTNFPVQ